MSMKQTPLQRDGLAGRGEIDHNALCRVLDSIRDALVTLDRDWRYIYVNARAAELSGMTAADMIGRTIWEVFPELSGTEMEHACRRALDTGTQQQLEYYHSPSHRWYEHRIDPTPEGLVIFTTNITDRRQAESRLEAVLASLDDAFMTIDRDWRITHANPRALEITQKKPEELLGKTAWQAFSVYRGTLLETTLRKVMDERVPTHVEALGPLSARWYDIGVYPSADGVALTARDIHKRKRAEASLREQKELLRQLMENSGQVFCIFEPDLSRVHYVNRVYETIFGRSIDSLYADASSWLPAVHPDDRARVEQACAEALTRPGFDAEFRVVHPDGTLRWVRNRLFPVKDVSGQIVCSVAMAEDVSERKHAEQALRHSRERLRLALDAGGMGAWEWDITTNALAWDPTQLALWGMPGPSMEITMEQSLELVHPDDRALVDQAMQHALQTGDLQVEFRICRPDGQLRWLAGKGGVVRDASGHPARLIGVNFDITERRLAERALRDSEERFRSLADSMPQFVWTARPDGTITFINQQWVSYSGITLEQTNEFGMIRTIVHPDDAERTFTRWAECLATGKPHEVQSRYKRHSDGAYRWFLIRAVPCRDADGHIREWFGTATDVDEQKRAEEALRESEQRFRMLADSAPVHIWMDDEHGRARFVNARYCEFTGLRADELLSAGWHDIVHPDDRERYLEAYREATASRTEHRAIIRLRRHDGVYRRFEVVGLPRFEGRRCAGYIGCSFDVTERFEAEEALREADRRKDEFLATLAHELRNPLSPMSNAVQLMRQPGVDPAVAARAMGILERQLAHMVRLIDDLLDINRISRNKLELRKQRIELSAAIQAALETSRPLIEASGHELTVSLPDEPVYLDADLTRLGQVFSNLLTNAAKYTDRGGRIRLTAERHGHDVVVSIADSGIGIAAEHLPRLFEMFSQLTPALQRSQGGLGIGLTLVRGLVEMHGGSVEARSGGMGKGSEFVVRLPMLVEPATSPQPPRDQDTRGRAGCRILVVDDLRDAAESLAMMLTFWGHEARVVHDGLAAVETAAAFRPAVILLDIGLPLLNGYEVARRIRAQPWGEQIVIIALTGWGQEEDRRRALEGGCNHHLTKPVDPAVLAELLATITGAAARAS
jgi:PAS domain S-box-containing protein